MCTTKQSIGSSSTQPITMKLLQLLFAIVCVLTCQAAVQKGVTDLNAEQVANFSEKGCLPPFISLGGRCLMFEGHNTGTWQEMRDVCQYLGGDMVKVDSADLLADIVDYIHETGMSGLTFYIGGTYSETLGEWQWLLDGSPVRMGTPTWYPYDDGTKEPDSGLDASCLVVSHIRQHHFADSYCTNSFAVICEEITASEN